MTMKTVPDMAATESHQEGTRLRIPYPSSGWSRLFSLLMAIALAGLILIYPRAIATSISEVNHGVLSLLLWGIAAGFVHGVGFVPRMTIWRIAFHPFIGWPLMLYGILLSQNAV
jgi:cyd operon protein YbgE